MCLVTGFQEFQSSTMSFFKRHFPFFFLALLALGQTACKVTNHLDTEKGERLLVKNKLDIKSEKRLTYNQRSAFTYALEPYYKLKPNRRPLLTLRTPWRLWWYYRSRDRTKKFDRWIMKKVAEPPALYQESLAKKTAVNFQNQMRQRGYFNAECDYKTDSIGEYKVSTVYHLRLGPLYTIDTVHFDSRDSLVLQILLLTADDSRLRRGDPVDGATFDAEKIRITSELKNRGYAYFIPNFIEFDGDSSGIKTNVTVRVLPPTDSTLHKTYVIDKVAVLLSLLPDVSSIRSDTSINNVYYASAQQQFEIKPRHLASTISIRPDWPYRQIDFDKTQRDLNALGLFRFVAIKPYQDSLQPEKINVDISFTPAKRLTFGADVGLNSSTSSLSGRLLGGALSTVFQNRNLFRGAEHLEINGQYNVEFDLGNRDGSAIFSQEFKIQNSLLIPRFFDYLGVWRNLHDLRIARTRLVSNSLYERMRADGKAHINLSYNYLQLINFYRYNLFNASFGYEIRTNPEHQYSFNHIGIDVLRPKLDPQFDDIFGENQFLQNSFDNQLFTGFLLRSFSYTYASKTNAFGERWVFRVNTDVSGVEELILNRLWSIPFSDKEWRIGDLEFSKYLRADLDATYTRDFTKNLTGALRIGSGVVQPFGGTRNAPYVKQFYVGGPSSLRAWRIREIGPGGYRLPDELNVRPFYQSGDFRFELNGELRFPIFYIFKGAIFVDAGNVWNLKPDAERPNAELRWDSYKNIAIGTGLGIRMDITFAVLRVDAGLPLRRPYQDELGRYWVANRFQNFRFRDFNWNIAVGYPF